MLLRIACINIMSREMSTVNFQLLVLLFVTLYITAFLLAVTIGMKLFDKA